MKVLILGGSNSRNSGGIFNSARQLGINVNKIPGNEVHVLMHSDEYSKEDIKFYHPLKLHNYSLSFPRNVGYSKDLLPKLEFINPDIIHTQSIWQYFSKVNLQYFQNTKTPYIVAPRGMLDNWQLKQSFVKNFKKKIALSMYEMSHLRNASCIHALCFEELKSIRKFGLTNPIAVVPNGVVMPDSFEKERKNYYEKRVRKRLLFLSRIHVKKGLDNLLKSWSKTNPENHNWKLSIAGETKDREYMNKLLKDVENYGIQNSVEFLGGMFGEEKRKIFIESDGFILPSYSEGLPMAVLEAWSYKLPTIITPFCNLGEAFDSNASIGIETDVDSICEGILKLINMKEDERLSLAFNGYELVKSRFTWDIISSKMNVVYKWVLGIGEKPDFIYLK